MHRLGFMTLTSLALLLLLDPADAGAEVPRALDFQGVLVEADGTPLDREVILGLELHLDVTNGLILWSDVIAVTPRDGIFSVRLGRTGNPLPENLEDPLFLEISVDGEVLAPRQSIVSTAFALRAAEADRIGGLPVSELDQRAAVDGLQGDAAALTAGVAALENQFDGLEASPVFDLEGLVNAGPGETTIVEGELVVQNGNVPITTVGGFVGLNVQSALQDGVRAVSVDDTGFGFGGLFMHAGPTSTLGVGVYALGNQPAAPDLVLGANDGSQAGDNGVLSSDLSHPNSDIFVQSMDAVVVDLDHDATGTNSFFRVAAPSGSLFEASANGTFKANGLTTAFPIAVANISAAFKVQGGFNVSSVSKPVDKSTVYDVILTSERGIGRSVCEANDYAILVTPENDVDSWKAQKLCPPSNDVLFRIHFRNFAGIDIASGFSVVIYKL